MTTGLRACKQDALAVLLLLLLVESLFVVGSRSTEAASVSLISPSSGWGIFAGTVGDIEVVIDCPGVAVRIEIPREFMKGRKENDTSFLSSDISNDHYYYSLFDQSLHYSYSRDAPGYKPDFPPYDPNAPFLAEIWSREWTGFVGFKPPKHVWMKNLVAPTVAGKYDFLMYVADKTNDTSGAPLFPINPTRVLPIMVSKGPFPSSISGFIVDPLIQPPISIKAKGIVYALDKAGDVIARCFVDNNTGFFNMTGLSEGEYILEASAGYWRETGYSYMPTRHQESIRLFRNSKITLNIMLKRGCMIKGKIKYTKPDGSPIPSLSHPAFAGMSHPWSNGLERISSLNYTVQALTDKGEVVASCTAQSTGLSEDLFVLTDRAEIRHVGYPPVGTAYSGFLPGKYVLKAWVFGYVQKTSLVLTVTSFSTENVEVRLVTGGTVVGTIGFCDPRSLRPETPRMAEKLSFGTSTGTLYGGNVLVSAYDSNGQLAALSLIRGAMPNGTTAYADRSSIRFCLLGFSESLNRTFSGIWQRRDCGIPSGTYSIKVQVRGYLQASSSTATVFEGSNSTAYVALTRQGAISTVVMSSIPLTEGFQSEVPWAFQSLTPHPRLRVYAYGYDGCEAGYVETRIGPGSPATRTPSLNFTGRNCTIPEIIFQGYLPSSVTGGTYTLKVFTFGYIQGRDTKVTISDSTAVQTMIHVYPGVNVSGTVWIMAGGYLASITEETQVRIEAYGSRGTLAAVNFSFPHSGAGSFNFTLIGFRGVGHFFYVTPNGDRIKDYGLPRGTYTFKVHDFGSEWRYRVRRQPTLDILTSQSTMYLIANRMNKISGKVLGTVPEGSSILLSWVAVDVGNESTFSIDGRYILHVEEGSYVISFKLAGYLGRLVNCTITGARQIELDVTLDPS